MLSKITIKLKLIILTIFTAIGFIILIGLSQQSIHTMHELGEANGLVQRLDVEMLNLRKHEKDFLARKDLKYLQKFEKTIQSIYNTEKKLKIIFTDEGLKISELSEFVNIIKAYESKFKELVKTQQVIGINPKDGLYGSLRDSVHKVQEFAKKNGDMEILASVYDLRKQEKDFMLRRDLKYIDKFNKKHSKLLNSNLPQNAINNLKIYKKDFLTLVKAEEKMGLTSKLGILGDMRKTIHQTSEIMHKMEKVMDKTLQEITDKVTVMSFVVSTVIMLIIIGFIYFIAKNITASILSFQTGLLGFFDYLNRKSTDVKDLESDSLDEIGAMAKVVNGNIKLTKTAIEEDRKIIDDTILILAEFEQGDLSQRVNASTSNPALQELTTLLNKMGAKLEENIEGILNILNEYSNNNYLNNVSTNGIKEHLLQLADGINSLGDAATETLLVRKRNGLTLQSSATTLKGNVESISKSSNIAASSLEETAAALEEITSTIINNSNNVTSMAKYANKVTTSANDGEELANDTMKAMDEINAQVNAISDAISVIDQIAFQTNILSLNAAVEAATAGEAGKGFAVVAQEVRNLAARSADAASEIKSIVDTATVKANKGKDIAQSMLSGYQGLNIDIDKTIDLIKSVDAASKEQQSGIEQINDAVSQLDKQTQINSSAALETNEISITTEKIAERILEGVNKNEFKGKDKVSIDESNTKI